MGLYYNGKKVRNLYYNGKCITRLALGKELTHLVEGDDFVRAKWLVGDGSAHIDTNIIVNTETLTYALNFVADTTPQFVCGSRNNTEHDNYSSALILVGGEIRLDAISASPGNFVNAPFILSAQNSVAIDCEHNNATVNGTTYNGTRTTFLNSVNTFRIFDVYPKSAQYSCFNGSISTFTLADGTHSLNLTPCRLLRPIPSTLDANGIARNADECGMYNSVNGLFYGNVGSGTFTVSDN